MKEFEKYAKKHLNVKSSTFDEYIRKSSMTPNIIEEKKTNFFILDVFSRLMAERIIFLGTEINNEVSTMINAQLLYLEAMDPKQDISIYINSPGGSVYDGLAIYDTMQLITPKIKTVNVGLAASMAAVILCGGEKGKRQSLKHARTMIHQPWGHMDGGQASDIEITAKEILKLKKDIYEIIAKHSGQPYKKVHEDGDRDYWMNSTETKKYGLIDEILLKRKD